MRAVQPGGPEAAAGRPRGLSLVGWAERGPELPRPGGPEDQLSGCCLAVPPRASCLAAEGQISEQIIRVNLQDPPSVRISKEKAKQDVFNISVHSVKSLSRVRLFVTPWAVACTRLLRPWGFLVKSTGVGCCFLL